MALIRQIWTLTTKTLLIAFARHAPSTIFRAFILPVVFIIFITYAKNLFIPPSVFGIGDATPVRSLTNAIDAATGGRNTIAFVHNGFQGGEISQVIDAVANPVRANGKNVQILEQEADLLNVCRTTLRGVSTCYGAAVFYSSPTEGPGGRWNYTLRADAALGIVIKVDKTNNDAEIYPIPLQHAVDFAIASTNNTVD